MGKISKKSVIPFNGERTCIVSPLMLEDEGDRNTALNHLRTRLATNPSFQFAGGIIHIRRVADGIYRGPECWGGDGIHVLIAANHGGADLSEALGKTAVVYDRLQDQLFHMGKMKPAPVKPAPVKPGTVIEFKKS